ncbi:hypothetical protein MMC13_006096 [Lambiella insularis]|nr:hypothetical protein [Lambiella insularis]
MIEQDVVNLPTVEQKKLPPVTVAIVGGGVAGLFLANALEQSGISFVLFETASSLSSQTGASIGMLPHGLRLLDQINVLAEVEKHEAATVDWEHRDGVTGELLKLLTAMAKYPEELGYGSFFLERRQLLEILYDSIKDKSSVRPGQKVVQIETEAEYATVHTEDGITVECQLVAGADGVRSTVRKEMIAYNQGQDLNGPDYLDTQFACIYGMSTPLEGLKAGRGFSSYRQKSSCFVWTGAGDIPYWFVFKNLGRSLKYGKVPRFSQAELESLLQEVSACTVTEGISFKDLLAKRTTAIITPLEEGVVKSWYHGRMVLLGDSAHKMVPNAAMGGNLAMESAASLLNMLHDIRKKTGDHELKEIPISELEVGLPKYAEGRQDRANGVVAIAGMSCRAQLLLDRSGEQFVRGLSQLTDELWLGRSLISLSQAEKINDWKTGSPRVDFYTRRARQIQEAVRAGQTPDKLITTYGSNAIKDIPVEVALRGTVAV